MRLMLISLVAMSGAGCASSSDSVAINPFANVKARPLASIYTSQSITGPTKGGIKYIMHDGPTWFRDCILSGAEMDQFVRSAASATPAEFSPHVPHEDYYLEVRFADGAKVQGYLDGTGKMLIEGGAIYRLTPPSLQSILGLLESAACYERSDELGMPLPFVPAE